MTVTDINGCFVIDSAVINQPSEIIPEIIVGNVTCYGGSDGYCAISSSGGTAPYSYLWSNGINNDSIADLSAGMYSVSLYDSNNCTLSLSSQITEADSIHIISGITNSSGNNGSINISVSLGVPPYTFVWSNNAVTEDISGLAPGNYSVTLTDNNGCIKSKIFIVGFICPNIIINLTSTNSTSNLTNDGEIISTVSGGVTPYSYNWSNGNSVSDINNLIPGQYCLTVTDNNNCNAVKCASIYADTIIGSTYVSSSTKIEVCFSATHTYVSDLGFYLLAPGYGPGQLNPSIPGQIGTVELLPTVSSWTDVTNLNASLVLSCSPSDIDYVCNGGNNVNNFCFTTEQPSGNPAYTACVCDMTAPLTGTYASAGSWSYVYGFPVDNGGWSVQLYDCEPIDVGVLTNAKIKFTFAGINYVYDSDIISKPINDGACDYNSATIHTFAPLYVGTNPTNALDKDVIIYPNPSDGKFYISIEGLRNDGNINIIDVTGKSVFTEILTKETKLKQVDLSTLPKGIYAVKVTSGDVVKVSRIVVQ
ncbi:MAG: hypothetical protein A2033_12905 [Bacteroidetes bacterium GWA2_31_9]|nr:MAG: hypothetical protein A2033_12905 [Bacteroidetes bacterium GWA2_31_9]